MWPCLVRHGRRSSAPSMLQVYLLQCGRAWGGTEGGDRSAPAAAPRSRFNVAVPGEARKGSAELPEDATQPHPSMWPCLGRHGKAPLGNETSERLAASMWPCLGRHGKTKRTRPTRSPRSSFNVAVPGEARKAGTARRGRPAHSAFNVAVPGEARKGAWCLPAAHPVRAFNVAVPGEARKGEFGGSMCASIRCLQCGRAWGGTERHGSRTSPGFAL